MKRSLVVGFALLALTAMACGDDPPDQQAGADASIGADASTDGEYLGLTTVTPARNATQVSVTTAISLTFSEPLNPASATADNVLVYASSASPDQKVAGSVTLSADKKNVTIAPAAALEAATSYTILARGGASGVASATGLLLQADTTSTFTTAEKGNPGDTVKPTVVGVEPNNGAQFVALNSSVTVTFSEPINPTTINASTMEVIKWWDGNPQGAALTGTFDTSGGTTAVFTPAVAFERAELYRISVRTGVKDLAGNPLEREFVSYFDTSSLDPGQEPKVLTVAPADGATGVATTTTIQLVFNKYMAQSTLNKTTVVLEPDAGGTAISMSQHHFGNPTFIFTPQTELAANTTYKLVVKSGTEGALDEWRNPMLADFVARFTTGAGPDASPLEVVSITPTAGATGVDHTTDVEVTFNKAVDPATLFLAYPGTEGTFRVSNSSAMLFPEVGSIDFSANPVVRFKIDPNTTYQLERTYYVRISETVKSLSGAAMAAAFNSTFVTKGPDNADATIEDLRAVNGPCALRVKGAYMTFYRDGPNHWNGFFIQKEKTGPAIFVVTGDRKPQFPVHPDLAADGYPNIDITVTRVEDFEGFKQVRAYTMTRNQDSTADLEYVMENLVQVIGDEPVGAEHESEYVQIDGVLSNFKPGSSIQNHEWDLSWGTGRKLKMKISDHWQEGIESLMGIKAGSRVRVTAPVQKDAKGYFIKPYVAWDSEPVTKAALEDPANYIWMLDIVNLAD